MKLDGHDAVWPRFDNQCLLDVPKQPINSFVAKIWYDDIPIALPFWSRVTE